MTSTAPTFAKPRRLTSAPCCAGSMLNDVSITRMAAMGLPVSLNSGSFQSAVLFVS